MKKIFRRPMTGLILICLLCLLFSLPVLAAEGEAQDLLDNMQSSASDLLDNQDKIPTFGSLEDANTFMGQYSIGILLIVAVLALVVAVCGYRALHLAILLGGFSAGCILGYSIYGLLEGGGLLASFAPIPAYVPFLVYVLSGILGAVLAVRIIRAGIFLVSAVSAFFFLSGLPFFNQVVDLLITEDMAAKYLLSRLIVALLVGMLSLIFTRPVLIITTGLGGGMVASICLMVALGQTSNTNFEMVIGLVLACIGIIVQFTPRRRRRRSRR